MKQGRLRGTLLATSSALALIVAVEGTAQAVPPSCAVNNTFVGLPNTTAINCISFNDGANHTGDVTNASNGTITPVHPYPPVNGGTSSGISIVGAGTKLTGNITNNGSIVSAPQYGINVGGGQFGTAPPIQGAGASVTGSIINNGSITGASADGILVFKSSIGGSITNGLNGTINTTGVGIAAVGVSGNLASIGGSIINSGSIAPTAANDGVYLNFASVGGSISNTGTITDTNGSGALIAARGSVAGSITNSGTINAIGGHNGFLVDGESVGGSVSNIGPGTITAGVGLEIQRAGAAGAPTIITQNVSNSGTITATTHAITLYSATVGGAVLNSGTLSAGNYGILVLNYTGAVAGASVAGGVSNSGTITSTGVGLAGAGIAVGGAAVISNGITNTASGNIQATQGVGILLTQVTAASGNGIGTASVAGGITNQGTINAKTGIMVTAGGVVTGGITNGGNLTGSTAAIDVTGEGAATVINQQGGTITGAILLSALGDTVNVTGGAIAGNIVGTGASGTVNFALGAGTFSYSNTISGVSAVNVNSGTLFDNSSIAATLVSINGGALAPGQPGAPGTLSVTGSLVFASAATYMITINGANASKTNVTGTAAPGGASVKVASGSTVTFGQTYTILTASGGVTGTFNPSVTFGSMTGTLTYDADDVFLTFGGGSNKITPLLPPGSPQNVLNVAGAIDNFLSSGGTLPPGFLNLFGFTPQQLVAALTQLSGEAGTGAQQSGFQLMNSFLALLTGPAGGSGAGGGPAMPFAPERAEVFPSDVALAYASVLKAPPKAVPHWTTWAAAFGGTNSTSGDPTGVGSHDMTAHAGAVAAGADYHVSPDTIVGFSLAGGGTGWDLSAGLGGGRSDAFLAGLYGSQRWGQAYLSGALTYSSYWMSTSRTITATGPDTLSASFNAQSFGGRLEGGYVAWSMPFRIIPYAAVQAQSFHAPAYGETGALGAPDPAALSFAAQTATAVRSELGSRFDQVFGQADGGSVDLFGRLAWAHDWQSNPNLTATFIGLPIATFVVNGAAPPKDLALLTAGAERRWRSGWSIMGKFDGELGQRSQTYTGTAKVSYTW